MGDSVSAIGFLANVVVACDITHRTERFVAAHRSLTISAEVVESLVLAGGRLLSLVGVEVLLS